GSEPRPSLPQLPKSNFTSPNDCPNEPTSIWNLLAAPNPAPPPIIPPSLWLLAQASKLLLPKLAPTEALPLFQPVAATPPAKAPASRKSALNPNSLALPLITDPPAQASKLALPGPPGPPDQGGPPATA